MAGTLPGVRPDEPTPATATIAAPQPASHGSSSPALRDDVAAVARWVVLGAAAGGLAGLLVGGVGGRLAMLLLRFTSPHWIRGLRTDDGFRVGDFGLADTAALLTFTTALGVVAGVVYAGARSVLPARWRVPAWTVAGAVVGGSSIVHGDGVDFTALEPEWLAVALFVALPAAGAWAMAAAVERWSASWWWRDRRRTAVAAIAAAPLLVPTVALAVVVPCAIGVAAGRLPAVRRAAAAGRLVPVGSVLVAAVMAAGGVALVNDLVGVLG